jgi:signal transduction histidine kinase
MPFVVGFAASVVIVCRDRILPRPRTRRQWWLHHRGPPVCLVVRARGWREAGAFLLGTWRWRLFMGRAMHRLTVRLRAYSRQIESAAYFCCLEAMQNAAKHARDATAVVVELSDNGALRFEVRDDGAGFDAGAVTAGVGLTSMRDRVAASAAS